MKSNSIPNPVAIAIAVVALLVIVGGGFWWLNKPNGGVATAGTPHYPPVTHFPPGYNPYPGAHPGNFPPGNYPPPGAPGSPNP